ncbi:MAG: EscU/YscU/HrcU family type III secretion system export apparatus switch protein [Bdellovibrionales bacterium]|nr:EscU/YscU/HrcU family type III secretion system export apparatus switch protein [Bdellovibrionales bacterium]
MAEKKAFEASKRKLDKARKEGNILKSQILTQAPGLLMGVPLAVCALKLVWVEKQKLIKSCFINSSLLPERCAVEMLTVTAGVVAGILFVTALCGVAMELAQVGWCVEFSLLAPKSERLNPAAGVKRIGSGIKNIWKILTQYLFLSLVLLCALVKIYKDTVMGLLLGVQVGTTSSSIIGFSLVGGVAFVVVGIFDFVLKRKDYRVQLSMSHDEVMREYKDMEGDPAQQSMRRQLHEEVLSQDMIENIKRAKVIVVERAKSR